MIRVLIAAYPSIGLRDGGLQRQISNVARQLALVGADVRLANPWEDDLDWSDVLHIFSLDQSLTRIAETARSRGIPVVVSPISLPPMRPSLRAKSELSRLPAVYGELSMARRILQAADLVVCLNEEERTAVGRVVPRDELEFRMISNGTEGEFLRHSTPDAFEQRFGKGPFVTSVGRVEPSKGQLQLVRAARYISAPVAIVGPLDGEDQAYVNECMANAGANVVLTGAMEHGSLLASAFAATAVLVLLSRKEVQPIVLDEAIAAGARLVVTRRVPVRPEFAGSVTVVRSASPRVVARAIERSLDLGRPSQAAVSLPTWRDTADLLMAAYVDVAGRKA